MDILSINEIYSCSLHELLPVEEGRFFLIYSPLSTMSAIASSKELSDISNYLESSNAGNPLQEIVSALLDRTPSEEALSKRISGIDGFVNMSLLLNNKCNFNCSYCYSARGHSKAQIDEDKLLAAIDFFIDSNRTHASRLSLTFLGGGEPMLSWNLIEKSVHYSKERAKKEGFGLSFKIVSNGSILTKNNIDFIRDNNIELTVSFEILEEIQNLQRKHFDRVSSNIRQLSQSGILLSINSVITPNNVDRQMEMMEEVIKSFPQIDYLSFEPLMTLNDWSNENINEEYYDKFINNFLQAMKIAKNNDIELSCSLLRNVDCTVERYCAGELAVCPDGSITVCPCVSSPEMNNYEEYLYGYIDENNKVNINTEKLSLLLKEDVHSQPSCRHCIAKWNCGGGCVNTNRLESKEQKQMRCDFVRNFTKHIIWNRTKEQYESDFQQPILEILSQVKY